MVSLGFRLTKPLNSRYAPYFVNMCNDLPFVVRIITDDRRPINSKSLLGVLSCGLREGDMLILEVQNESQAKIVETEIAKLNIL